MVNQLFTIASMIELIVAITIAMSPGELQNPKLDWWRDARFGMFIHWGLYAVPAGTWGDRTGHAEWIRTTGQIPLETYDKFVDEFNPVKFDADAWCEMANDAGMGYIVITSKHHDGFCLFDSVHTDFDIMSTPFKRDIMKELAEAAPKHDIHMSWYHSIMDWHHPDYLPRRSWETERSHEGADMQRFRKYLHAQVTELLTNYGPIGIMWFDGEWESTWRGQYGKELYELCISLQPEVIVNNRLGARGGMEGLTGMEGYAGGYGGDYMTPEQEIPDAVDKGLDWETCMTMNDRWGYNMHDKNFKSTTDLLQKLSDIVSKNGNFLLNVGPKPDGTFPDESIQRLSEIGDWMDVNGEAILGTIGSPFRALPWGRATQKFHDDSTTLYLHVFDWPEDGTLVIPGLSGTIKSTRILGGSETTFTMAKGEVVVDLPLEMPNEHIGVVAVEVQGKPVIFESPKITSLTDEFVFDLEIELSVGSPNLEIRYSMVKDDVSSVFNHQTEIYTKPFKLNSSMRIDATTFYKGEQVSKTVSRHFTKVLPRIPRRDGVVNVGELQRKTYTGTWDELPDFSTLTPEINEVVTGLESPEREFVAWVYTGYLYADSNDMYMFALSSDDGSRFLIGDSVVVDNDGLHGTQELYGSFPLANGWHKFRLEWFNKAGGASLNIRMGVVGCELIEIPSTSFASIE